MKKINFSAHILPHIIAVAVFLIVTVFFFKPVFFDKKSISQHDIEQWAGSSKALRDYRDKTGEEGLWAGAMFSGMPAYLVNVQWSNKPVTFIKQVLSVGLPHPIANIYLAFICYYILLLAFGVRPYLAIGGALAFGLSSYMTVGLAAGHNARIGAIAFMPLVIAGVHLAFSGRRLLGFGVTAAGLALHLKENHLQITYYMGMILVIYAIIQLVRAIKEQRAAEFAKSTAVLIPAAVLALGSFIGPFWAVTEYGAYTIRGKSEIVSATTAGNASANGLSKSYVFEYTNGLLEPMTLMIPNIYGGHTHDPGQPHVLALDKTSEVYKALSQTQDQKTANQLAGVSYGYWGPQGGATPYYAGAVIVFLFAVGIAFAERRYVTWLVTVAVLGILMSWGDNFKLFNYFLYDYLPGYNKFRSVTFTIIMAIFAMPLLGLIGLEKIAAKGIDKATQKKLLIVLASTAGLCLFLILFGGFLFSFMREGDENLPPWFLKALIDDRTSLLRGDAFRSMIFMLLAFVAIYFEVWKKIAAPAFYAFLIALILFDIAAVDKRYLTDGNYRRKREVQNFVANEADQQILSDKSYFRVYNIRGDAWAEARTSYFHNSIGGYHGAKLRRYQDLFDSCITRQTYQVYNDARQGQFHPELYGSLNMLNVKYMTYETQVLPNPAANGPAWFVQEIKQVNTPTEELKAVCDINTRTTAVVDVSKFKPVAASNDTTATIAITENRPNYLKYESQSQAEGLAVFSEIYYEKGWNAFIDGKEAPILRANYVLRALNMPAGKHTVEFRFEPKAYTTGNTITKICSILVLLTLLGCLGWSLRKEKEA